MSVLQTGFGNAGGDYTISRSVRLRSSASAYFNRTPASAGNRRTFTYSGWLKRGLLDTSYNKYFFSAKPSASVRDGMYFGTGQTLSVFANDGSSALLVTTQVFRDPSAWYHVVVAVDTTQATASNRVKIYVNGTQVTSLSTATYPTQNYDWAFNNSVVHTISDDAANVPTGLYHFDGYMTEINVIDGQALTPSSFGETDTITGVWKPKRYTGTYGTNGFYLNFSDNSNNTAATIGKDSSGNGNNWTPNNVSVTAGSTYDSMLDTPTPYADGGNGRANYAVLNPINHISTYTFPITNGNLTASGSSGANYLHALSSIWFDVTDSAGYYFEFDTLANYYSGGGLTSQTNITSNIRALTNGGVAGYTWATIGIGPNIYSYNNGAGSYSTASCTAASGTVFGCFVRGGKVWFRDSAGWLTGDPNIDTSPRYSGLTGTYAFCVTYEPSGTGTSNANFGQRPFAYTPPTGFKALNTQNLPDATIKKGSAYFDATTYTGNGSAGRAITTNVGTVDFAWVKLRSGADDHRLANTVTGGNKHLQSNTTAAEGTGTNIIQSFSGSTFTVGSDASVNANGSTYIGWTWQAGGTAVSNTAGSITSSVSAGVSQGFSVATFTAPASNQSFTVGHGLGVAPKMTIVKRRDSSVGGDWWTWHIGLGDNTTTYLALNQTTASATAANMWGTTGRNSTVCGFNAPASIITSGTYVMYNFAEVAGYSKFGSYTGNGSTDGPFVFTGMRPRFVMIKRTDSSDDWFIIDTSRNAYNVSGSALYPNSSSSETTNGWYNLDVTSNGFKVRASNTPVNASGGTYIFMALAENPFKNSLAR